MGLKTGKVLREIIITVLVTIPFGIVVFDGVGRLWHAYNSERWMRTTGRIINSQRDADCFTSRGCLPNITYEYTVNGISYEGDSITPIQPDTYNRTQERKKLEIYKESINTQVFYNPERPQVSCLEPGFKNVKITTFIAVLGCSVFIVLAVKVVASRLSKVNNAETNQ